MMTMRYAKFITTFVLFLALSAGHAFAQVAGNAQSGSDLLRAGEGSLAKGKFTAAAGQFGRALRSNDLSDAEVARTLYKRGLAYEKSERPAQAIADITNALFLKGLSGSDRAKAYLSRGRAYEAVGLSDLARSDISRAKSGGLSESQIAHSSQGVTPSRQTGGPAFSTTVQSAGQRSPARETRVASFETQTRAPAPPKPEIPRFRTTIVPNETPVQAPAARTAAVNQKPSAPAGWSTATQQGDGTPAPAKEEPKGKVSSFLGGLWQKTKDKVGGGDKKESAAPLPPAAPSQTAPSQTAPQWNQTTSAATRQRTAAPVQSPRAAPATGTAQGGAANGGSGYRIQLAALRSEPEAQATWKRLASRHKNFLGNRQPNIVRTELGGLGTFYRVQIGPFSSKTESQQLCKNFKQGGLDCFLLAP
jgi:cell division septation protein DedD